MSWVVDVDDFETELKNGKYKILIEPGIKNVIDIINKKKQRNRKIKKWVRRNSRLYL